jgi:hypothetical protein
MRLKRVPGGRYPCRGDSVEVMSGTGREAGLGHGTGLNGFDWGIRRKLGVSPETRCEYIPVNSVSTGLEESELDVPCKLERLRVAHPCALSRSTAHPVHKLPANCARLKDVAPTDYFYTEIC